MIHRGRYGCKIVGVGRDVCYIRFARTAVVVLSQPQRVKTTRGEELVFDYDADGHVIGIELLGGKPCQEATP